MKKVIVAILGPAITIACAQSEISGSGDFSSQNQDIVYHSLETLNAPSAGAGAWTYNKFDMKANGNFEELDAVSLDGSTGTKCHYVGTWSLPSDSAYGNELVVSVTSVNGSPVTLEKRYDLRVLSYETLKVKSQTESAVVLDMTNNALADYPELVSVDPATFGNGTCN